MPQLFLHTDIAERVGHSHLQRRDNANNIGRTARGVLAVACSLVLVVTAPMTVLAATLAVAAVLVWRVMAMPSPTSSA